MMIMVDDTSKKVVFLSNRACRWWYVGVHWRGGSLEPIMIGEWNIQMLFTTFAQITRINMICRSGWGQGVGRGLDSVYAGRGRRFIESRDGRKSLEHLVSYVNKETSIKELTTT